MMALARRKHWLLGSLSCTALLIMLMISGSKSPVNFRQRAEDRLLSLELISESPGVRSLNSGRSSRNQEPPWNLLLNRTDLVHMDVTTSQKSIHVENHELQEGKSEPVASTEDSRTYLSNVTVDEVKKGNITLSSPQLLPIVDLGRSYSNLDVALLQGSPIAPEQKNTHYIRKGKKYFPIQLSRTYNQLLAATVNAAKFRISREYVEFPGDINFIPGHPVPKDQVRRILILTTWRSGSTFLGDIFNAYPGVFYSFEPLHQLLKKQHFEDGPEKPEIVRLLKDIMNCNINDHPEFLEYARNNTFLLSHNSRYWTACAPNRAICYDSNYFNQVCEVMPVNVIKTVRLGAMPVQELMEDLSLDLRVIHLVRDPRGTLHSRLKLDWCRAPVCNDPEIVCRDLLLDLEYSKRLQDAYPDRFLLVRYEDLGSKAQEMTRLILDFVGLTFTDSVKRFLADHTKLDDQRIVVNIKNQSGSKQTSKVRYRRKKPTGAYTTFRDSLSTTFAWRNHFNFSTVSAIQNACNAPMTVLNLRIFENEVQFKNENISVLLPD